MKWKRNAHGDYVSDRGDYLIEKYGGWWVATGPQRRPTAEFNKFARLADAKQECWRHWLRRQEAGE